MSKQTCVVKFTDGFGVEHSASVEAESIFEAAIRGLYKLDSSFWTEEQVFDRGLINIEVWEAPTTHQGRETEGMAEVSWKKSSTGSEEARTEEAFAWREQEVKPEIFSKPARPLVGSNVSA